MTLTEGGATNNDSNRVFLPNFCSVKPLLVLVIISELLAFVLTLASLTAGDFWQQLSMMSLFIQWVTLLSAGLLCLLRPYLSRFTNVHVGVISYCLLLVVTLCVSELSYQILEASAGDSAGPGGRHFAILVRNLAISAILSAVVLRYLYIQHQWKLKVESELQARIQALQSRIRPHFLFNSMNTIASLIRSQPQQAERAVEDLSDLFRISLGDASSQIQLAQELEISKQYLNIEKLRLGDRLQTEWQIDNVPGDAMVPALILQPLLENAVYHGIEPLPGGGKVAVTGKLNNGEIRLSITNPVIDKGKDKEHEGNRIAQENISQRLDAVYGIKNGLRVSRSDAGYEVTIRFPYTVDSV